VLIIIAVSILDEPSGRPWPVTTPERSTHRHPAASGRVNVCGLGIDAVTEQQLVDRVVADWSAGRGGWVVTPNVDIWLRARRDDSCARLIERADVVVADGMPLVWAARLAGDRLPERVTGSGLVERLSEAAGRAGRSVYLVGGGAGETAALAGAALAERYPGLRLAGCSVPPFGFEHDAEQTGRLVEEIAASAADLVLVGLGFPKQERLAELLVPRMPRSWILGCGGGVAMAAGETRRSPRWAQRMGVEWVVRLLQEPRRLARRYLVDDAPAALVLLAGSLRRRVTRRAAGWFATRTRRVARQQSE
jgi:N-acetylglucosaminyldiphosphoundecaprenol N-acetyl-beta-D-mannosaminyltransferase